jgi:uncharacterized protein YkwD
MTFTSKRSVPVSLAIAALAVTAVALPDVAAANTTSGDYRVVRTTETTTYPSRTYTSLRDRLLSRYPTTTTTPTTPPTTKPTTTTPPVTSAPSTTRPTTSPAPVPPPTTSPATSPDAGAAALAAINADRATGSLAPLASNGDLVKKAQQWSKHLADSSGGVCSMGTLVHSQLSDGAPAGWRALGENVGCRVSSGDLQSFVAPMQANFMASPGHRANIMSSTFNVGGAGFATVSLGNGTMLVFETQVFAKL